MRRMITQKQINELNKLNEVIQIEEDQLQINTDDLEIVSPDTGDTNLSIVKDNDNEQINISSDSNDLVLTLGESTIKLTKKPIEDKVFEDEVWFFEEDNEYYLQNFNNQLGPLFIVDWPDDTESITGFNLNNVLLSTVIDGSSFDSNQPTYISFRRYDVDEEENVISGGINTYWKIGNNIYKFTGRDYDLQGTYDGTGISGVNYTIYLMADPHCNFIPVVDILE